MRSRQATQCIVFLVCAVALASALADEERIDVGAAERVQERANAVYSDESRRLSVGSRILFRDLLETGSNARLEVILEDDSVITLGEKAELIVDEFIYEPGQRGGNLALTVAKGAFLFVGGKIESIKESEVKITTPVGILGIRGTTVWGGPIDTGYGILVLDGEVTVTTPAGDVTIPAGRGTMIYGPDRKPLTPYPWDEAKTARAVATISFAD
jgi:hypothetical protein